MAEYYSIVGMNYSLLIHLFIWFLKINIVLKIMYFFLVALGLVCCTQSPSSCGARASRCSGFSWCGAAAPGARTWWLWCTGFSCPQQMESSLIRDRTRVPCLGRWTLSHWATREVLHSFVDGHFMFTKKKSFSLKQAPVGNSLVVQWLRRHTSTGGTGSVSGQGTKTPQAVWREK